MLVTTDKERFAEAFIAYILTIPSFFTKMPPITIQILLSSGAVQKCLEVIKRKLKSDQSEQLQFLTLAGSDLSHNAAALLGNYLELHRVAKGKQTTFGQYSLANILLLLLLF
jgi:hypothetical protein